MLIDFISRNVDLAHRHRMRERAIVMYNHIIDWLVGDTATGFVVHALSNGFTFSLSDGLDGDELFWKQRLRNHYSGNPVPDKALSVNDYSNSNTPVRFVTEDMITKMYRLSTYNDKTD